MNISDYLKSHIVYLDGGLGTLLQAYGLLPGELPERWNITHPEAVIAIHRSYFDAGSNIVVTNTFGANSLKFGISELEEVISAAVNNAEKARSESSGREGQEKFIALDIGPIGKMLKPYGELDFEEAVSIYSKTVKIGVRCGIDLIFIETMNDSYDTKAALLAAKENSSLPVFVSNAYGSDGKLMTGASPEAMVAMLEGMGADAIGANCSLGPAQLGKVIDDYLKYASVPVLIKPNAGLPVIRDGKTSFDITADEFSDIIADYCKKGVRLIGGCCGTTPEYIGKITKKTDKLSPIPVTNKNRTVISSYTHAVDFFSAPVLIGERINPTGKKQLKEALLSGDTGYVLNLGISQQENGAHVLDVNTGLPEIDEASVLKTVCTELQAVLDLPLQIDTSDPEAMEKALRVYNGKAMINSVCGKKESMERIFPLVKKYGGLTVCLTLDENGIPETAEGRVKIAEKIISVASKYGIEKKDLIFDTLAMAVSADQRAAMTTLKALEIIKTQLNCHTLLGVSNVSFGLPHREIITSAFFTSALERGLSAAIMNPLMPDMMKTYYSYRTLHGLDGNCADYIANIERLSVISAPTVKQDLQKGGNKEAKELSPLQRAVVKGLRKEAALLALSLLEAREPLEIVNGEIVPALDIVGTEYENKTLFLPQLLMSAEAAQYAFEKIKEKLKQSKGEAVSRGIFVLATVKGDIHDIGKNIVRLLLENYGFEVFDLGKDVSPETVTDTVKRLHSPLVGLSALMTTTVPAMEETVKQLRKEAPWVRIAVGGAVLTEEYAKKMGADFYGRDAMATVRYALSVISEK